MSGPVIRLDDGPLSVVGTTVTLARPTQPPMRIGAPFNISERAMNEEHSYPLSTVIALATWISTAGTLALAWIVWMLDGQMMLAILIAETACTLSAVAAVLQLRCFINRNLRTMRALLSRVDDSEPDPENLRRI